MQTDHDRQFRIATKTGFYNDQQNNLKDLKKTDNHYGCCSHKKNHLFVHAERQHSPHSHWLDAQAQA